MATRAASAEQRRAFSRAQKDADPQITQENYRLDMIRFLSHHNRNTDIKVIRGWAVAYVKANFPECVEGFQRAVDFDVRTVGIIARAIERGYYVSPQHLSRIEDDIYTYSSRNAVEKQKSAVSPREERPQPKEDKEQILLRKHMAEIDAAVDEFVANGTPFDLKSYLKASNVSSANAKLIAAYYGRLKAELAEAVEGKCPQLKEAYAYMGKVRLKRFLAFVSGIIDDCAQQTVSAKVRAPRAKKEKPASVIVNKMRYLREFPELKLKSEPAANIVGASIAWLYDTARRRLTVYVAEAGQKLSVHRTAITGFSVKDSAIKTLRKPEEFLKGSLARKTIQANFDALKTKPGVPNGRVNEDTIILKIF